MNGVTVGLGIMAMALASLLLLLFLLLMRVRQDLYKIGRSVYHLHTDRTVHFPGKGLEFEQLRRANLARCEEIFHPLNSWSLCDWGNAMGGEAGEAQNIIKKLRRLQDKDKTPETVAEEDDWKQKLSDELADLIIYADLCAARAGISLGAAIIKKFNRVSIERGSEH